MFYSVRMKSQFCGFRCTEEFLKGLDARAQSLHMSRSQYIVQVLRQELATGRPNLNVIAEKRQSYRADRTSRRKSANR